MAEQNTECPALTICKWPRVRVAAFSEGDEVTVDSSHESITGEAQS